MKSKNINKYTVLCVLALFPLLFMTGCPTMMVKQIEENIRSEEKAIPKDYKPVYMNSSVPVNKLREQATRDSSANLELAANRKNDSTLKLMGASDSAGKEIRNQISQDIPLKMEIRNVNANKYPDEVNFKAIIFDSNGRYITGLAPPFYKGTDNYRKYWKFLYDSCNGKRNQISDFDVQEVQSKTSEPLALSFVLDHSPSMGDLRALKLQQAVVKILTAVKSSDFISVIKYSSKVLYEVKLTNDPNIYRKDVRVDGLKGNYGMGTATYDAVMAGIREVMEAPKRNKRIVILFTDGDDNSSKIKMDSVLKFARHHDITIYTIAYGIANVKPMIQIADYTGGKFYHIYSSKEFMYVFADIYVSLNNYYRVTYKPPLCNDFHSINLVVNIPEAGNKDASAHGSYDKSVFTASTPVGTITFMNIEFEYGKSDILPESIPLIEQVAKAMKANKDLKLRIAGHTDDRGSEDFNMKLSLQRANAVRNKLTEMGVDGKRLETEGFGKTKPLVPNDSEENRHKNRRTEFIIIEN